MLNLPKVLVLTPIKDADQFLDTYIALLENLDWPRDSLAIGVLESDSADQTWTTSTRKGRGWRPGRAG